MIPLLRGLIGAAFVSLIPLTIAWGAARLEAQFKRRHRNHSKEALYDLMETAVLDAVNRINNRRS